MIGVLAVSAGTAGQGRDTKEDRARGDARDVFAGAPDDVLSQLNYLKFDRKGITEYDPFTLAARAMQKLNTELDRHARLRIGFAWTALYQGASRGREQDAASADFDFFGRWRPLQTPSTLGYLIFQTEVRYKLGTDITPSELGNEPVSTS